MELNIDTYQVADMVADTARNISVQIRDADVKLAASDSYGDQAHRTWAFMIGGGIAFGSIERYWGGLKMICSVLGGAPRTSFFLEDGTRTTNKILRGNNSGRN